MPSPATLGSPGNELPPVIASQVPRGTPHCEQVLERHDRIPGVERPRHFDGKGLPRELVDHREDP